MKKISIKTTTIIFALILTAITILSSCSEKGRDGITYDAVAAMIEREVNAPSGTIYTDSAEEGESGYISPMLEKVLWGEHGQIGSDVDSGISSDKTGAIKHVRQYSHFLSSFEHPCEFAVFECYTKSGAYEVSKMCLARLGTLRNTWKNNKNEKYTAYAENAQVCVKGRYVIMAVSSDPETAIRAARKII